jgi:23S rRNA (cytidine1920-2'-O)/16S rRNA (cytidine1409-2'-O)-methyltransferase
LIESGSVLVNGFVVEKVASQVDADSSISLTIEREEYVSRGARKLLGALEHFGVTSFQGMRALDAGASTGGFTEVLVKRGIEKVYSVDVGYGQMAWTLRNDPHVVVIDRTNIRDLSIDQIEDKVDVIVADLSFISLCTVMDSFASVIRDSGEMFLMVKPQFEVGKGQLSDGGVVRDPRLRRESVGRVAAAAWDRGFGVLGVVASSLPGPSGNVEYFLWLRKGAPQLIESDLDIAIEKGPQ